jgi:hypothetical protein
MKSLHLQKTGLAGLLLLASVSMFTSCSKLNDGSVNRMGPSIMVTTFAGGGVGNPATVSSPLYGRIGSADGAGTAASFNAPADVVMDATGNLYVSEAGNYMIRKITSTGIVSTFVGNTTGGFTNGNGAAASFSSIQGIAIDASGNLYVADSGNEVIRKVTPDGTVSTFAGTGIAGSLDGPIASASFKEPTGIAVDAAGVIYVAEFGNKKVRKIATDGTVSTLAGSGAIGYDNGAGTAASFTAPARLAVDASGNVYLSDLSLVRKITPGGTVSTLAGNVPASGYSTRVDGKGSAAGIVVAGGISIDAAGNIYLGDEEVVRKITPDGTVSTLAGGGSGATTDGPANQASFGILRGLVVSPGGSLIYVTDYYTSLVRKIQIN